MDNGHPMGGHGTRTQATATSASLHQTFLTRFVSRLINRIGTDLYMEWPPSHQHEEIYEKLRHREYAAHPNHQYRIRSAPSHEWIGLLYRVQNAQVPFAHCSIRCHHRTKLNGRLCLDGSRAAYVSFEIHSGWIMDGSINLSQDTVPPVQSTLFNRAKKCLNQEKETHKFLIWMDPLTKTHQVLRRPRP